ncbi:MAG: hypothetical protein Q8912_01055 [Bacillota bacterium]|nr:hypothetical protein [Bacillota bacterium]
MDNIQYDPQQVLNGFTEDSLKELAKRLKRKINLPKNDIIEEILSPHKGKAEDKVKIWQEINRLLRKELETLTEETYLKFSAGDVSSIEQYKIGYMFTLSTNPEIRTRGEELYCQAEENKKLEQEEILPVMSGRVAVIVDEVDKDVAEVALAEERIEVQNEEELLDVQETEQLQKRVKTLENKLRKANLETIRTKAQLEKVKNELAAIKARWVKEKEEAGKYRNILRDLEEERVEKETELEILKQKLEQTKTINQSKTKEQLQRKEPQKPKDTVCGDIDLASFQGRKALIFAERDKEIEIRLSSLGIISIWAMEIDWNRPRRRMSTCEIVLYKKNEKITTKLNEIREVAGYWNIPCCELLDISGGNFHD